MADYHIQAETKTTFIFPSRMTNTHKRRPHTLHTQLKPLPGGCTTPRVYVCTQKTLTIMLPCTLLTYNYTAHMHSKVKQKIKHHESNDIYHFIRSLAN